MSYIEELDDQIVEPVSLEETKEYLGYADDDTTDDALLNRLITTSRSILENGLGRTIVFRKLRYRTEKIDGPYKLAPFVNEVTSVSYEIWDPETEGYRLVDTMHYEYDPGEDAVVYAHFPRGARHICIDYIAGYEQVPEVLKMAILDIVKMKKERTAEDPFEVIRPTVESWKVHHI